MPIFTNVNPSLLNSTAEGTVDATDDLIVSFVVEGSAPMTTLGLDIVKIDDDDPDEIRYVIIYHFLGTISPPFYGKDNLGNIKPFTKTIAPSDMTFTPSVTYENDYQYEIRLNGKVAAVFQAKEKPVFTSTLPVDAPVPIIRSRQYTVDFLKFSDTIQWFQWKLGYPVDIPSPLQQGTLEFREVIYDTGKVYGSGDMTLFYDGFLNGGAYVVECTACSSDGIIVSSGGYLFACIYNSGTLQFPLVASPYKEGSAVQLDWHGANYMLGTPTGNYEISDDYVLYLPTIDDYITWDAVGTSPMSLSTPWTVVYKGLLLGADAILWELNASDASKTFRLRYAYATRTLTLEQGSTTLLTYTGVFSTSTVSTILYNPADGTDPELWLRLDYMSGGLYPAEDLYPATTLYPSEDNVSTVRREYAELPDVTANAITGIILYGAQKCYYIQEIDSDEDILNDIFVPEIYDESIYEPRYLDGTNFYATFESGLQAGSLYIAGEKFAGWEIYRRDKGEKIDDAEFWSDTALGVVPIDATRAYDYSARTDGTIYMYGVAPIFVSNDANHTYTTGLQMNIESPFGIRNWNYSILECQWEDSMNCYHLLREYDFGKNVSSGDMSNNNAPNVLANFTQYPTVQLSQQNYKSGTLTSLIGIINYENGAFQYSDTRELRDAIFALSTTSHPLFLKTRKGDVFEIRVSNPITMSVMDETQVQALEAKINWVEVADATTAYILGYE